MKLIAIFLTAAALTSAAPHLHIARTASSFPPNCLSPERANYIVQRERVYLLKADLNEARAAGEELFADDFVQYGDSINSLREQPLGAIVEPNGTSYIENTLSAPPLAQINSLAVINNCTHIFWQWSFLGVGGLTTPNPRVNGFVLITVDNARTIKPVVEQYVEFNSLAWAENSGFTVEPPTEGPFAGPE